MTKLTHTANARRVMTLLLTLSLLAISQQNVKARHAETFTTVAIVSGVVTGLVVWALMRNGDDPPDPSTPASPTARSFRGRPVRAIAENVVDKQFGIRDSLTTPPSIANGTNPGRSEDSVSQQLLRPDGRELFYGSLIAKAVGAETTFAANPPNEFFDAGGFLGTLSPAVGAPVSVQ